MKTISAELEAHLAGECTTMATCWLVTRKDLSIAVGILILGMTAMVTLFRLIGKV